MTALAVVGRPVKNILRKGNTINIVYIMVKNGFSVNK